VISPNWIKKCLEIPTTLEFPDTPQGDQQGRWTQNVASTCPRAMADPLTFCNQIMGWYPGGQVVFDIGSEPQSLDEFHSNSSSTTLGLVPNSHILPKGFVG